MADVNLLETDLVPILTSFHGQQRRKQRNIVLNDLKAAIKYGKKERSPVGPNGDVRWMYTFAGIVFITDETSKREITSWTLPAWGIETEKVHITRRMQQDHKHALQKLQDKSTWTSHTVVVVDQSGSMRKTDTKENISRSDMVWLTLAVEFVAKRLKSGERKSTDVFSLVSMRKHGEVVLCFQPFDWILYNRLIDLLRKEKPLGDGNYLPALETAKNLLMSNQYGGCALMLMFLSDGRPSDRYKKGEPSTMLAMAKKIRPKIEEIAKCIGGRLTVGTIPLGESDDEFITLRAMAEGAKEYGCHSFHQPASLSSHTLAKTMSTLTSTVTSTMIEMTGLNGKQRQCRRFQKEKLENVGKDILNHEFTMVEQSRISDWKQAIVRTRYTFSDGWVTIPRRRLFHSSEAVGVAMKKAWFGEGAERLVKEFREVDAKGNFVGPIMVAKDTKYIRNQDDGDQREVDKKEFHRVFCKTQLKAQRFAQMFNRKMARLPDVDHNTFPLIEFLDCSVYMIEHATEGRQGYLVERMLDIKSFPYQKWNDNAGRVGNTLNGHYRGPVSKNRLAQPFQRFDLPACIEEEEDEEEESVEEELSDDDDSFGNEGSGNIESFVQDFSNLTIGANQDTSFTMDEVPQAFSCFTYWRSRRKLLICDLQGVFNTKKQPPVFELTDPVIHHRLSSGKHTKYGRTDKGSVGIHNFFETHKCSNLCRMLRSRFHVMAVAPETNENPPLVPVNATPAPLYGTPPGLPPIATGPSAWWDPQNDEIFEPRRRHDFDSSSSSSLEFAQQAASLRSGYPLSPSGNTEHFATSAPSPLSAMGGPSQYAMTAAGLPAQQFSLGTTTTPSGSRAEPSSWWDPQSEKLFGRHDFNSSASSLGFTQQAAPSQPSHPLSPPGNTNHFATATSSPSLVMGGPSQYPMATAGLPTQHFSLGTTSRAASTMKARARMRTSLPSGPRAEPSPWWGPESNETLEQNRVPGFDSSSSRFTQQTAPLQPSHPLSPLGNAQHLMTSTPSPLSVVGRHDFDSSASLTTFTQQEALLQSSHPLSPPGNTKHLSASTTPSPLSIMGDFSQYTMATAELSTQQFPWAPQSLHQEG